jgi:hypothetical protein
MYPLAEIAPGHSVPESLKLYLGWLVSHHFRHALESANLSRHANPLSPIFGF